MEEFKNLGNDEFRNCNYEKAIDEATIDFGNLAEEVMGNKDENIS